MNDNSEAYPEDLNILLQKANDLATDVIRKLNKKGCKCISDLYNTDTDKVIRNTQLFDKLGYKACPDKESVKKGKTKNEFKGLYIFGEEHNGKVIPVYVGISRVVYKRLRNHAWGKTANTATLAFLMAKNTDTNLKANNRNINDLLIPQKEVIRNYKVHLIPEEEDYDLYFLEVTIAGILKTKWNSFRTH